jgi:hypothetical protein
VVTNLRLVGDEGEVLTAYEAARFLNEIVHTLPWQDEVQRALRCDWKPPRRCVSADGDRPRRPWPKRYFSAALRSVRAT